MTSFNFRGLEFHSSRMWQWAQVERALDLMQSTGLNALVFHQNDIVEELVFPQEFFPDDLMWKRWPVRMHAIYQNRHYINKVAREARERGIGFYVEIKEIWFVDELLELVPDLRSADGSICPSNPFWWRFLDIKMRELVSAVPDLAGVIVSPGTRESKVSISTNTCTCERCKAADALGWYSDLLRAMYVPLAENGKTLAVRDFSYTAEQQSQMIEAAAWVSDQIVISLKNTPHDYYPTFPNNPRIGNTGGLRQWVEFDTWGQFFGMGFFPLSVAEDMQARMRHCAANGVEGIQLRTDWEVITEASSFNSLNVFNVIAGAMLAGDIDLDLTDAYAAWTKYGLCSPLRSQSFVQSPVIPAAAGAGGLLEAYMKASWAVMEKAAYVRGHLFHEDDQYPDTVDKAFAMMVDIHGRDEWEPGASKLVEPTDANLAIIFAEKEKAIAEVQALPAILKPRSLGLSDDMAEDMETMLDFYERYVRGYALCARTVFLTRKAETSAKATDKAAALDSLGPMRAFIDETDKRFAGTHYPHYVYWLFDTGRLVSLCADVERRMA